MVLRIVYMAAACLLTIQRLGVSRRGMLALAATWVLVRIAEIDRKTMKIPNTYLMVLLGIAGLACFLLPVPYFGNRVLGAFCVSLPMYLLTLAIPGSFGGGDIKMMAVCGFFLGVWRIFLAGFISVIAGGVYAVFLLVSGKAKPGHRFAFGPYLAFGVWLSMLFGRELVMWYFELLW